MSDQLRVRAVGEGKLALIDLETGATLRGRWCGRDRDGAPLASGELVPCHAYFLKALEHGDLELVPESA